MRQLASCFMSFFFREDKGDRYCSSQREGGNVREKREAQYSECRRFQYSVERREDEMNGIKLDVGHRYIEGRMSFIKTWRSCSRDKPSSPGDDGISYQFLYQLSRNGTHHLLSLFNVAWSHCKLPTTWKHARKIPIPKSTDRTACRPISLLSCVGKKTWNEYSWTD